jgi:hypothetical protein
MKLRFRETFEIQDARNCVLTGVVARKKKKNMAARLIAVIGLCLVAGAFAFIDECSQFRTCETCLNVTNSGLRTNCGWCHVPIVYDDGTQGAQCADIRDKPWHVRVSLLGFS